MMPAAEPLVAPVLPASYARSRPCIVDPRLAVSADGLLAAARLLTTDCSVWIARELRETLKTPKAYLAQPDKLAPRPYGAENRALGSREHDIQDALGQWAAVLQGPLSSLRFFHLGEHAGESVVPPGMDHEVVDRFERLAAALDALAREADYDLPRGEAISACFRDTAALCAALAPYGAFVLSTLEVDRRAAPALCDYLDAWGIAVHDVTSRAGADADSLRALVGRAGLGPVEWSGAQLAAIHVIPPGLGLGMADAGSVRPWKGARAFWHLV
jgi:hypothetical protein